MQVPPFVPHTVVGKQEQVGFAGHAAGISRQNGSGFTQGGGRHPGPGPPIPVMYWQ